MKRLILWVILAQLCNGGICRAEEKIVISELLNPSPGAARCSWSGALEYRISSARKKEKRLYVVTWKGHWTFSDPSPPLPDDYSTEHFDRLFPLLTPDGLLFSQDFSYTVFETDGKPVQLHRTSDSSIHYSPMTSGTTAGSVEAYGESDLRVRGFVMNLNGDGIVNVFEEERFQSVHYVTVRRIDESKPLFVVAYDWGDYLNRHDAPWTYALRPSSGGQYDIVFGPKTPNSITPEVIFHWDAHRAEWICKNTDKHLRVIDLKNAPKEIAALDSEASRGKEISVQDQLDDDDLRASYLPALTRDDRERLLADQGLIPYRYKSLAKLDNGELLAWLGAGRGISDFLEEHSPPKLPPDFWRADPKSSALAFAIRNRPKDAERSYRLAIDDLDGVTAPEEGTVAISTARSESESRSLSEDYFLRCSRGDSYLTLVRKGGPWGDKDALDPPFACDIRKAPLTYEEARRILQTIWWLDRIRSKQVDNESGSGGGIGSPGDMLASIRLESPQGALGFEGFRFHPSSQAKGVSTTDAHYDRTAFLNLAALLMDEELPKYLADRWNRFDIRGRPTSYSVPLLGRDYSKTDLADLKAKVAQQLRLFPSGDIGQSATKLVVAIAEELGLAELKPDIEKIASLLPLPSEREKRLGKIAIEIMEWQKRLGPDETDSRSSFRRRIQSTIKLDPIPDPPGTESKPEIPKKPAPPPPDPKFASLDALFAEQEKISHEQTLEEKTTYELRTQIQYTLRWFAIKDDPQKLYEFAIENVVLRENEWVENGFKAGAAWSGAHSGGPKHLSFSKTRQS